MRSYILGDESTVAQARRAATAVASRLGFSEAESGRVSIVATELSTNLIKHGGGGELLVGAYDDGDGAGVELIALDRGGGISNLAAAMRDGHSTAGSPGTGMGSIERQSNLMDVYSHGGNGVAVLARLQRGRAGVSRPTPQPVCGAVCLPVSGEDACGDAWCVQRSPDAIVALVVDGLGHGPLAATAAHAAVCAFEGVSARPERRLIERLHEALKSTRGAAASILRLPVEGDVEFIGVGNVMGLIADGAGGRRMVAQNGTLGHVLKTVRAFTYPARADALAILASDGLSTSWSLDAYPGLQLRHPTLIAAVLYRDFSRKRDDVTVLVARREAT